VIFLYIINILTLRIPEIKIYSIIGHQKNITQQQITLNHKIVTKMKKIITLVFLFVIQISFSQINIVAKYTGHVSHDVPAGTYIKDVNNTFTKFLGTWKWQEGSKVLIFKIEKVTQYHYTEYDTYEDFIKGNYSYSIDGGATYVVNTISQNLGNDNPKTNPMYTSGTNSQESIKLIFKDVLIGKTNCDAKFTFLINSNNQMKVTLSNDTRGYFYPEIAPNQDFSIPNNVVLTKQ
jgi:hypothetical protein